MRYRRPHAILVVIFALVLLPVLTLAQTRSVTFDGATLKVDAIHCSPNDAGGSSWSCSVCATVANTTPALSTCEAVDVKATVNVNRLNALALALSQRWLNRQAFDVDAGSP
jgi:hypothetical protein